ncbi:MAG: hypothetical protein HOC71_18270 [Candidatus Latescibacteria bacterium]|jgi:GNAT superfamily N-acetyltransferase|nr:hypothetical protein [Candidatus Latescibacterota bacterium]
MTDEKKGFLGEISGNIHLEPLKQEDFNNIDFDYNILVDSRHDKAQDQNHLRYYTFRERDTLFIVGFKRAAYEHGEEFPYDGRENYINKITYIAVSSNTDSLLIRKLLARAMLDMKDEHLIFVTTKEDETAKIFESLNFTRISWARNSSKQYVFSFKNNCCSPKPVLKTEHLSRKKYGERLPENERRYHAYLQTTFEFDIISLVMDGWTIYRRNGNCFAFILTMGESRIFCQETFKLDLFDITNDLFVGYADVHISPGTDTAISDLPAKDFPTVIPVSFAEHFGNDKISNIRQADDMRLAWFNQDAIWVRKEYRRAGIGQALERIAGDICKLVYDNITSVQVCVNFDNPQAHYFHRQNGAVETSNKLYNLEYRLNDSKRPIIKILYGM